MIDSKATTTLAFFTRRCNRRSRKHRRREKSHCCRSRDLLRALPLIMSSRVCSDFWWLLGSLKLFEAQKQTVCAYLIKDEAIQYCSPAEPAMLSISEIQFRISGKIRFDGSGLPIRSQQNLWQSLLGTEREDSSRILTHSCIKCEVGRPPSLQTSATNPTHQLSEMLLAVVRHSWPSMASFCLRGNGLSRFLFSVVFRCPDRGQRSTFDTVAFCY